MDRRQIQTVSVMKMLLNLEDRLFMDEITGKVKINYT